MAAADPRVTQLARILGCSREELDGPAGVERIKAGSERLASGLFEEAAASDDVVSAAAALEYLELRLAYLGDLVPGSVAEDVRGRFADLARQWQ